MFRQKLIILFTGSLLLLWVLGYIADRIYISKWKQFSFCKIDACLKDTTKYDILFLGDSRVQQGINPYEVDQTSGLRSFNLGYPGGDARLMHLFATQYIRNHPAPQFVFINVDEYAVIPSEVYKETYFLLFYLSNDSVNRIMKDNGYNTTLVKSLPFTKYCYFNEYNRMSIIAPGLNKTDNLFDTFSYKGFTPLNPAMKKAISVNPTEGFYEGWEKFRSNDTSIHYLENMILALSAANTKVILYYPPTTDSLNAFDRLRKSVAIQTGMDLSKKYGVPYIEFHRVPGYPDSLFYDRYHLNKSGAAVFSAELGRIIAEMKKGSWN